MVIHKTEDQDHERDIAHIVLEMTGEKNTGAGVEKDAKGIEAAKDETRAEAEKDTDIEATMKIKTNMNEVEVQAGRES